MGNKQSESWRCSKYSSILYCATLHVSSIKYKTPLAIPQLLCAALFADTITRSMFLVGEKAQGCNLFLLGATYTPHNINHSGAPLLTILSSSCGIFQVYCGGLTITGQAC